MLAADWTSALFEDPIVGALRMEKVLTLQLDNLIIVLYVVIAYRADLFAFRIVVNSAYFPLIIVFLSFVDFFKESSCLLFEPVFGCSLAHIVSTS